MMERFSKQFKLKQDELGELISTFVDRKDQILKAIGSMSKLAAEFRKLGYLTEKHHKLVSYLQPRFEVQSRIKCLQEVEESNRGGLGPAGHAQLPGCPY